MGQVAGYIPAAVGGKKVHLAHTGFFFVPTAESMARWRGWWRIVRADQWGIFFAGALLGMVLPALLYVTFLSAGTDIRGLGIAATLAQSIRGQAGAFLGGAVAFLGAWILFKTQLDIVEGMTRAITDMLWTGSSRIRARRGGDVPPRLLRRPRRDRALGNHRPATGAADRAAPARRQHGGDRLRRHCRSTFST